MSDSDGYMRVFSFDFDITRPSGLPVERKSRFNRRQVHRLVEYLGLDNTELTKDASIWTPWAGMSLYSS